LYTKIREPIAKQETTQRQSAVISIDSMETTIRNEVWRSISASLALRIRRPWRRNNGETITVPPFRLFNANIGTPYWSIVDVLSFPSRGGAVARLVRNTAFKDPALPDKSPTLVPFYWHVDPPFAEKRLEYDDVGIVRRDIGLSAELGL
jgi:hypothetical protein